jgi:hypothetical protein
VAELTATRDVFSVVVAKSRLVLSLGLGMLRLLLLMESERRLRVKRLSRVRRALIFSMSLLQSSHFLASDGISQWMW